MDPEAALLDASPTTSTISSPDLSESTYPDPATPYSPHFSSMGAPIYKKIRLEELTPKPTLKYSMQPGKPKFRIQPPYLMICISIIEVCINFFTIRCSPFFAQTFFYSLKNKVKFIFFPTLSHLFIEQNYAKVKLAFIKIILCKRHIN